MHRHAEVAPLGSINESPFDKIFNVKGLLFTVQKALPLFQDGGSIILAASVGGSRAFEGVSVSLDCHGLHSIKGEIERPFRIDQKLHLKQIYV